MVAIRVPETVPQAIKAGVGATIDAALCDKFSKQNGGPVKGKFTRQTVSFASIFGKAFSLA